MRFFTRTTMTITKLSQIDLVTRYNLHCTLRLCVAGLFGLLLFNCHDLYTQKNFTCSTYF